MTNHQTLSSDTQLLPDEDCWGPGFGPDSVYPDATLDEIAQYVSETRQPGYHARLHDTSPGYAPGAYDQRAQVPPGYDAAGHPNRASHTASSMDPEIETSRGDHPVQVADGLQGYCRARGWVLDQHGRPLHPHHQQLLADTRIGLPTSLGYGFFYGEATVVDAVVTTASGHVLLTTRTTNIGRIPCLTGGYAIPADENRTTAQWRAGDRAVTRDGIRTTAARKVLEETGVPIPRTTAGRIVRAIRPVSSPHTLHAWTCTYTVRVDLGTTAPPRLDPDRGGTWVDVDQLYETVIPQMWPDHVRGLLAAIE
jgi:hypothetical protein